MGGGVGRDEADHDAGGVLAVVTHDGGETPVVIEVVLAELAVGEVALPAITCWRQHLHQLVGIDEPPPAHLGHRLLVVGERGHGVVRRWEELGHCPGAHGVGHPQDALARDARAGLHEADTRHHLVDAEALGGGCQLPHDLVQLVVAELARRPHVEHDLVHVQSLRWRPLGLEDSDAGHRLHQLALEVRQLHRRAGPVPHRGDVAHLRHGEQPLVLGIASRRPVEEVDVLLRRGQPLQPEVGEPLQPQPLRHHGMEVAVQLLLPVAALRYRPIGEVQGAGHAEPPAGPADGDHHPAQPAGERHPGQDLAHLFLGHVVVGLGTGPPHVEIEYHVLVEGNVGDERHHGLGRPVQLGVGGEGGQQVDATALVVVLRRGDDAPVHWHHPQPFELTDPVVAAGQGFEHQAAPEIAGPLELAGEVVLQRLRALHQRLHVGGRFRAVRLALQGVEVHRHPGVDVGGDPLEPRSLEELVTHLPRLAGQSGEAPLGRPDQSVEDDPEALLQPRCNSLTLLEAAVEDGLDRRQLQGDALLALDEPEERIPQLGCGLQVRDPVVAQGSAQVVEERRRQPLSLPHHRAQVDEQVLVVAAHRLAVAFQGVGVGAVAVQRAGVDEDGEDLVLAGEERPVVGSQHGRDPPVLGDELPGEAGVDVEAEHLQAQGVEVGPAAPLGILLRSGVDQGAEAGGGGADPGGLPLEGADLHERRGRLHLHVRAHQDLDHQAVHRGDDGELHLHGLQHGQAIAHRHLVSRLHQHIDHDGGSRGPHDPAGVPADAVGHPVDLDQLAVAVDDGQDVIGPALAGQAALETAGALDGRPRRGPRHAPPGSGAGPGGARRACSCCRGPGARRCGRRPTGPSGGRVPPWRRTGPVRRPAPRRRPRPPPPPGRPRHGGGGRAGRSRPGGPASRRRRRPSAPRAARPDRAGRPDWCSRP